MGNNIYSDPFKKRQLDEFNKPINDYINKYLYEYG